MIFLYFSGDLMMNFPQTSSDLPSSRGGVRFVYFLRGKTDIDSCVRSSTGTDTHILRRLGILNVNIVAYASFGIINFCLKGGGFLNFDFFKQEFM